MAGGIVAREELRTFLIAMRERRSPEAAGLRRTPHQRDPGLTRAQVARLASISSSWYARLESGRVRRVSPRTLAAVCAALQLSEDEAAQLGRLVAAVEAEAGASDAL